MADDWTDQENEAIVADYFSMLADDIAGRAYNKADHNRRLVAMIGRSKGSIEFKHQNISAVLKGLGEDWITGYKPAFNFQTSLESAVANWLHLNPDWLELPGRAGTEFHSKTVEDGEPIWIGPPPTHRNEPLPDELIRMSEIARKFDVAERDARNRALGRAGEERVLAHEHSILVAAGRRNLASQIRWVSEVDGDGAGYDIQSYEPDGTERLIEVKTTKGWERTPFYVSRNELAVAKERREHWRLFRLWNFTRETRAFELLPPLEAQVSLMATGYQAIFN